MIDKKFKFLAVHPCKVGVIYTEEDGIILLAKDNATPATLKFYLEECIEQGAEQNQIDAITQLIGRVNVWREKYPGKCKVADVEGECEIEQVLY